MKVDCAEERRDSGNVCKAFMDGNEEIESFRSVLQDVTSCEEIDDKDGNVLVKANHMITPKRAERDHEEGCK